MWAVERGLRKVIYFVSVSRDYQERAYGKKSRWVDFAFPLQIGH